MGMVLVVGLEMSPDEHTLLEERARRARLPLNRYIMELVRECITHGSH